MTTWTETNRYKDCMNKPSSGRHGMPESKSSKEEDSESVIALLVHRHGLKSCIEALNDENLCHAIFKTTPAPEAGSDGGATFFIPTNLQSTDTDLSEDAPNTISLAGVTYPVQGLIAKFFTTRSRLPAPTPEALITSSFTKWLSSSLPSANAEDLSASLPRSFTIYGSMLLFPPGSFSSPSWQPFLSPPSLAGFLSPLLAATGCTHAAVNAAIAPSTSQGKENVLRSPASLLPLAGDFGPESIAAEQPREEDFEAAYWTETKQNGLMQVWAPRWTMFSARNHREKTRVLERLGEGKWKSNGEEEFAVVDLYVGIGYFALSYLKAGARCVLGWDLNGFSIEGARRGAERNGFECGKDWDGTGRVPRLALWREDNVLAAGRIRGLRDRLPKVRHVNCGLLPTSRGSWRTAVEVLDKYGGWVHVHENCGVEEMDIKTEEVRGELERLVRENNDWPKETTVKVEEVFKVKSYAPGVVHCVLDVRIDPAYTL